MAEALSGMLSLTSWPSHPQTMRDRTWQGQEFAKVEVPRCFSHFASSPPLVGRSPNFYHEPMKSLRPPPPPVRCNSTAFSLLRIHSIREVRLSDITRRRERQTQRALSLRICPKQPNNKVGNRDTRLSAMLYTVRRVCEASITSQCRISGIPMIFSCSFRDKSFQSKCTSPCDVTAPFCKPGYETSPSMLQQRCDRAQHAARDVSPTCQLRFLLEKG